MINAINTNIDTLVISSFPIVWEEFTELLIRNKFITTLKLELEPKHITLENFCLVQTLTILKLCHCKLRSDIKTKVAHSLHQNNSLKHLDLSGNFTTYSDGNTILNALCQNTTLTYLNLSSNMLDSNNCATLAQMLRTNNTLLSLNLNYNELGKDGSLVADALSENKSLQFLGLRENKFSLIIIESFLKSLFLNTTLIKLDLLRNLSNNQIILIQNNEEYSSIHSRIFFSESPFEYRS